MYRTKTTIFAATTAVAIAATFVLGIVLPVSSANACWSGCGYGYGWGWGWGWGHPGLGWGGWYGYGQPFFGFHHPFFGFGLGFGHPFGLGHR